MSLIGFVTRLPFIIKTLYNNLPFEKAIHPAFIQKFRALQHIMGRCAQKNLPCLNNLN